MNKHLLAILGLFALSCVLLVACETKKKDPKLIVVYDDEDQGLDEFDFHSLKEFGINASIYLPGPASNVGATSPYVDYQKGGYKWDIFIGEHFRIRIEDWGKDDPIALHKEDLSYQNHMYDFNFLIDEPDLLLYEARLKPKSYSDNEAVGTDHVAYHCYKTQRINGYNYLFRTEDLGTSKEIADYVLKSVNSVEEFGLEN